MGESPRTDNPRIEELRRRVLADPASIAFAALAEEYRRVGRNDEAIETCLAGLKRHPSYLSAHVTLGRAFIEVGRYDEAEQELQFVLRTAPENLAAIRGMAEIHSRRGDGGHGGDVVPGSGFPVLGSVPGSDLGSVPGSDGSAGPASPPVAAPEASALPELRSTSFGSPEPMATIPTINFKAPDPVVEPTPSAFELATPPVAAEPVADVSDSSSWNFDTSFQIREPENLKPGTENLEPGTENLEPGTGNLEPEGAAVLAALEDFLGAIRAARR